MDIIWGFTIVDLPLGVSLGFHLGYEGYPTGKMDVGKYNEGYLSLGYHLDLLFGEIKHGKPENPL